VAAAAKSSVDLGSNPRAIVTMREFDAPRALVFEAWTDPKHLAQWWGPDGFSLTSASYDLRVGGQWRFVMHGPDGTDYDNLVTFEVIEKPARLVYSQGDSNDPEMFRTTVTFEALDDRRTRVTLHAEFPTAAERDRIAREFGAVEGAAQTLARLAGYLATMA
jgi:uncharacterized protein YndB with AHSA1/START domain